MTTLQNDKSNPADKWNNKASREIVDILAEIRDIMKGYFTDRTFLAVSGDASETRKISEKK